MITADRYDFLRIREDKPKSKCMCCRRAAVVHHVTYTWKAGQRLRSYFRAYCAKHTPDQVSPGDVAEPVTKDNP